MSRQDSVRVAEYKINVIVVSHFRFLITYINLSNLEIFYYPAVLI